jgi:hypothetical protein
MQRRWMVALVIATLGVRVEAEPAKKLPGKGFWKILVKPGAKWVLYDQFDKRATITIQTYDVRTIGKAQVARLRWTYANGPDDESPDTEALKMTHAIGLTQLAVTDAGLYLMWAAWDDAKVADELKKKPARSDPPRPYKATKLNEGRSLEIMADGAVCMGQNPLPGECDDCDGGYACFSATDGIVSIGQSWAPNGSVFANHLPAK